MATIWRGGCIIRARFLDRIRTAYAENAELESLLVAPYFTDAVAAGAESWRRVITTAVRAGIPTPTFSSSLAYLDALRRPRLPAALIQGLRDDFGAHTYQRVDRARKARRPGPGSRGSGTLSRRRLRARLYEFFHGSENHQCHSMDGIQGTCEMGLP